MSTKGRLERLEKKYMPGERGLEVLAELRRRAGLEAGSEAECTLKILREKHSDDNSRQNAPPDGARNIH